jgi:Flp pilus assembly protein TadG
MTRPTDGRERGQGLVEFALVLPLLALLVFGLFDAGRLVIDYTTLTNASRVGARVAIVNQSNDATCGTVRTFKCAAADHSLAMGIAAESIPDVVIGPSGTECATQGGCAVTVSLSHSTQLVTPVISSLIGPVSLSASTTMPIERVFTSP